MVHYGQTNKSVEEHIDDIAQSIYGNYGTKGHGFIHDRVNALRTAKLIPVAFKLFKKYRELMPKKIRHDIAETSPHDIQTMQIVAVMRGMGRLRSPKSWVDNGRGRKFAVDGYNKTRWFLAEHGIMPSEDANRYSRTIAECDMKDPDDGNDIDSDLKDYRHLFSILLEMATTIETIRDTRAKVFDSDQVSFIRFVKESGIDCTEACNDFTQLMRAVRELILEYQQFMSVTIRLPSGEIIAHDTLVSDIGMPKMHERISKQKSLHYADISDTMDRGFRAAGLDYLVEKDGPAMRKPKPANQESLLAKFARFFKRNPAPAKAGHPREQENSGPADPGVAPRGIPARISKSATGFASSAASSGSRPFSSPATPEPAADTKSDASFLRPISKEELLAEFARRRKQEEGDPADDATHFAQPS